MSGQRIAAPAARGPFAGRPLRDGLVLVACLLLCLGIGALGARVTLPAIPVWYAGLTKPFFTPPDRVFGPVWTTLYVLIAIALWRLLRAPDRPAKKTALVLHAFQLAFNILWSIVFFGMKQPAAAFVVATALVVSLTGALWTGRRADRLASLILIPYLGWGLFALALNGAIVWLN